VNRPDKPSSVFGRIWLSRSDDVMLCLDARVFFPNVVLTAGVRMGSFLGKYSRSFYFLPLA